MIVEDFAGVEGVVAMAAAADSTATRAARAASVLEGMGMGPSRPGLTLRFGDRELRRGRLLGQSARSRVFVAQCGLTGRMYAAKRICCPLDVAGSGCRCAARQRVAALNRAGKMDKAIAAFAGRERRFGGVPAATPLDRASA